MDPTSLSLLELGAAYRAKRLSPVEVTEAYLHKVKAGEVYRVVTAERAHQQARRAERLFARGVALGPLQGVPVALKDLVDTAGEVTAAGSRVLAEAAPAAEDAPVAARLDAAGAVFLGKTTMTELAFSGLGLNPHFGTPHNALDEARVPGGSSSGSAVAVARGLACAAVGSDTGGSVRIPASFNGLVGLKTTDGALPTDGCTALSTTLDTLGPITRTVPDAWALWLALTAKPYKQLEPNPPAKLKLLVPTNVVLEDADNEVLEGFEKTLEIFESQGHTVERRAVPELQTIRDLYARYGSFASHESFALYEDMLLSRGADIDPRVARRILEYKHRPASDYLRLSYARRDLVRAFWERYRAFEAVLAPTVAVLPPRLDTLLQDDAYFAVNSLVLRNTTLFNFLSGPAVSVPCAATLTGLSVGLMVAVAPHGEALALGIAALVELRQAHPLE